MESLVKHSTKTIEEYRHNIKLLKYHLKRQQKINETLRYKETKKHKKDHISKLSKVEQKHPTYSLVQITSQLNMRTKEMGLALGDVFRMADHDYEGEITKEQFMKTILRLKTTIEESLINQMFYAIDTDLNGHLSQDQYAEFLYAHGGCESKEAITFQKRSAEKLAAALKKKGIKMSSFLDKTVDPCPAEDMLRKLKDLKLNGNEAMILLKMWDPSLTGSIKHEVYLKSMQNVKQKDEKQIQNQKFEKGIQELCVILRDRKINPIVIFEESQVDGKPGISEFELEQGLKKLMPDQTPFQIRKWVSLINLNGDNEITRQEFVSAIKSFYSLQQINKFSNEYDKMHPQLKRALNEEEIPAEKIIEQLSNAIEDQGLTKTDVFHRIDINHNGLVDKEELLDGLKNMGINIGLIAKVLVVFDRDASGEISLDQWLNILGEDIEMEEVEWQTKQSKSKVSNVTKQKKQATPKIGKPTTSQKQKKEKEKKPAEEPEAKESIKKMPSSKKIAPKVQDKDKTAVIGKKNEPLKDQDKNKTLKASQAKSKKPVKAQAAKQSKVTYAQDSMIESRKDLDIPVSDHEAEETISQELQKEIAEMYAESKKTVLSSFKASAKNKKGINLKELTKCIEDLHVQTAYTDSQIRSLFEDNIANNGTFEYQDWLQGLMLKYDLQAKEEVEKIKQPQVSPKKQKNIKKQQQIYEQSFENESKVKQTTVKRGQNHQAFQGLMNLVVQNQAHSDEGYKFLQFIGNEQQLQLLNSKYLPLSEKIKSSKKIYKDPKFLADLTSLTDATPSKSNIENVTMLKWKHYSEVFKNPQIFDKGIEPNDICQGELGDCYFLCSLASLAEYKKLIERLFEYIDLEYGYFLIWLCIDGIWKLIQIDGYIPVKPNGKAPVFSRCREGDEELWVILLEKAYAKAYGCYEHIVGGQPYEAIKDLTGAPGQSFSHKSQKNDKDTLWLKLDKANNEKFIMTCGTDDSQKGNMKLNEHSESVTSEGIVIGHAYSILDLAIYKGEKLIQLRNPWGSMEWTGPWSDKSPKWTPEAKKALNYHQNSEDGIFWMPFDTYYSYYATTAINYLSPNYYYTSQAKKSIKNIVIKIQASSLKHGFLMVAQEDHRKKGLPNNTPYNVCHFIAINYKNGKILAKLADEKYMYQREGSVELNSEATEKNSEYIVIINLEKSANINLCTYANQKFEYELDDGLDVMLEYIEAIASVEESQDPKKVQTDSGNTFKSWLTSVGEYAFLVFKNITSRSLKIEIELKKPSNLQIRGGLNSTLVIKPGSTESIKAKIIDLKQPYSFGPMSFSQS